MREAGRWVMVGVTCVLALTAGCSIGGSSGGVSSSVPTTSAAAAPVKSALLGIVMPPGSKLYDSSDRHRGSGDGMDPTNPDGINTEIWAIPGQYLPVVQDMAQRLPLRHDFTSAAHPYAWCHEVIKDMPNDTMTEWTWGVTAQDMVAVRLFPNRESSGVSDTGLHVTVGPASDAQAANCVGSEPR